MSDVIKKTCNKCKKRKKIEEYSINRSMKDGHQSTCKQCVKEYNVLNKEKMNERSKERYQLNKESHAEYYKIYNSIPEIKAHRAKIAKEYSIKNKDRIIEYNKRYRETNREKRLLYYREFYSKYTHIVKARQNEYRNSEKGKTVLRKINYKRRSWGYKPLNQPFNDSEFHHLHKDLDGNEDHEIGLFIPKELHRSLYHNWKTGQGMDEINKLALEWYASSGEM